MKWFACTAVLGLGIFFSVEWKEPVKEVRLPPPVLEHPEDPSSAERHAIPAMALPVPAADERVETAVQPLASMETTPTAPAEFTITGTLVHPNKELLRGAQVRLSFEDDESIREVASDGRFELSVEETVKRITPLVDGVPMGASRQTSHFFAGERSATDRAIDVGEISVGDPISLEVDIACAGADELDLELWVYPKPCGEPSSYAERMKLPWKLGSWEEDATFTVSSTCLGGKIAAVGDGVVGWSVIEPDAIDVQRAQAGILLQPLRTYQFEVRRGEAPVPDAIVILRGELDFLRSLCGDRRASIAGWTDENGWLTITSVPPSLVDRVEVRQRSGRATTVALDTSAARQVIFLGEGCSSPGFQIAVRDSRGVSVPDASVSLGGVSVPYTMGAAVVDPGDPRGSVLEVEAEGFVPFARTLTECPTGDMAVVLLRERSLRVTVNDQAGAPVVGATVRVQADPRAAFTGRTLETDTLGTATFARVPRDEELTLHVTPPEPLAHWRPSGGGTSAGPASMLAEARVASEVGEIALTLERRPASFGSVVVRAFDSRTGTDLTIDRLALSTELDTGRHETVFVSPEYGLTESAIDVVPCGSYLLWVRTVRGDASVTRVDVVRDRVSEVTLPIDRIDELVGVVLPGAAQGFPLAGAMVSGTVAGLGFETPYTPDNNLWPVRSVATCDDAGAFRLQNLMAATYELRVTRPFNNMPSVVIEPGDRRRTIQLSLVE